MRRALSSIRSFGKNIRGGWKPLLVLYALDSFVLGQGVFAFLVGWVVVIRAAGDAMRGLRGDDDRFKLGFATMLAYVALDFAILGTLCANNAFARHRAERIIVAVDHYRADYGRLPQSLDDLVPPQYLSSVPIAKLAVMLPIFVCYCRPDGQSGFIGYMALPPFGMSMYSLEDNEWRYLD